MHSDISTNQHPLLYLYSALFENLSLVILVQLRKNYGFQNDRSIRNRISIFLCTIFLLFPTGGCVLLEVPEPRSESIHLEDKKPATVSIDAPNEAWIEPQSDPLTIEVTSPKGVGRAQIQLSPGQHEEGIHLRFQLRGLERLVVTADATTILASVSAIEPLFSAQELVNRRAESASTSNGSQSLSADHPFWLIIKTNFAVNSTANSASSTRGGNATQLAESIEVTIPPALLNEAAEQITIEWLDFYR